MEIKVTLLLYHKFRLNSIFLPKLPFILGAFAIAVSVLKRLGAAHLALRLPFQVFLNVRIFGIPDIISRDLAHSVIPFARNISN